MIKMDYLKTSNDYLKAFDILEILNNYFEEAMHYNLIKPSTYYRLNQGVMFLKTELSYKIEDDKYYMSFESLNTIVKSSKDAVLDEGNIQVKDLIEIEIVTLNKLIKNYLKKEIEDIDEQSILKVVELADKEIDKRVRRN